MIYNNLDLTADELYALDSLLSQSVNSKIKLGVVATYARYRYLHVRDLAWRVLIDCKIKEMPVDVYKIAKHYKINLLPYQEYSEAIRIIDKSNLQETRDAFCVNIGKSYYLCFNDNLEISYKRILIAHEIGHIILHHCNKLHLASSEKEANMFASRILMPMCVLKECNAFSPKSIRELCCTPQKESSERAARLKMLVKRDKFYTSKFEKKVVKQFKGFINSNTIKS